MSKLTALDIVEHLEFWSNHQYAPNFTIAVKEAIYMFRNQHVEIELLNKEIESLNEAKQVKSHQLAGIYRGDGEDNLESLTCPVIIDPAKLLEMTQEIANYGEMRADFQKVTLELHDEITRLQDDKTRLLRQESITYQAIQEQKELIDLLTEHRGRPVKAEFIINPDLIGGFMATIGDEQIDGSLLGAIGQLKQKLTHGV